MNLARVCKIDAFWQTVFWADSKIKLEVKPLHEIN